jgi:hypothetical protein
MAADPGLEPPPPPEDTAAGGESLPGTLAGDMFEEDIKIAEIMRSEMNVGAKLEIYRKETSGQWAYCDYVLLDEWTPEVKQRLARMFGGGDYRARVRRADATFGPSLKFFIDKSLTPQREDPRAMELQQAAAEAKSGGGMVGLIMQLMTSQQQQFQAQLVAQRESSTQILTIVTTALTRQAPVAPPVSEKLVELLATRALAPAAPHNELATLISALSQLRRMMVEAGGTPGPDGKPKKDFLEIILEALPTIVQMFKQPEPGRSPPRADAARMVSGSDRTISPAEPVAVSATEVPATAAAPAAAPTVPLDPMAQIKAELAPLLAELVEYADKGADPGEIADQVTEALDDAKLAAMQGLLRRPDWFAILSEAHEPVMMRSPWFTALREEILAIMPESAAAPTQ